MTFAIWLLFLLAASVTGQAQHCPNDWVFFENSCYAFLNDVVHFSTAHDDCRILNAKMLEVTTKEENDFVAAQIRSRTGINMVWQGGNDFVREGRWVFNSNGEEIEWFNWAPGQPDDSHRSENGEDCLMIFADGTWNDLWCELFDPAFTPTAVCEMDASHGEIIG